jgi:hypothetical protein
LGNAINGRTPIGIGLAKINGCQIQVFSKMAIRVEKEENTKQMLIFMYRMNLLLGSRSKHCLRHDVQQTKSNFLA